MILTNYDELAAEIGSILGLILGISLIVLLCLAVIYITIWAFKWDEAKKEYMKQLTQEQKCAINDYLDFKASFRIFKKRDKKQ